MKKILLATIIAIVAAVATVGVIYFIDKSRSNDNIDGNQSEESVLDLSKDYGACSDLDTDFIKTTLGEAAENLQDPENMGIVGNITIGEDVTDAKSDSQICVYAFEPGGTVENGFNSHNGLLVEKTKYPDQTELDLLIEQMELDPTVTEVSDIGSRAFYAFVDSPKGPDASHKFKLQVFEGNDLTSLTISQPADSATFNAETAKEALILLAKH